MPTYHAWMQDPTLRAQTASEELSLAEEYAMQARWRGDGDKLTFIVCEAPAETRKDRVKGGEEVGRMVGDVNLFVSRVEGEGEGEGEEALVGELE